MESDEQLLHAYGQGEIRAFEELVRRHRTRVFGLLCRLLRNDALAEEALIETFFQLHRSAAAYEEKASFRTYLFSIAWFTGMSMLRSVRRLDGDGHRVPFDEQLSRPAHPVGEQGGDLEARISARQDLERVDAVLESLPELERAVFILYYREGLETGQIAVALNIPAGSVRAYLTFARRAVREALEAGEGQADARNMARRG